MAERKNGRRSKFGRFKPKRPTKPESELEYKNVEYLSQLIGPTGKILSRRRTGFDGQAQRKLASAIKLARFMGLLPYCGTTQGDRDRDRDRDRDGRDRGGSRPPYREHRS